MTGMTLMVLGVVSCTYAWSIQMRFRHSRVARWVAHRGGTLARSVGIAFFLAGATMWISIVVPWLHSGFGPMQTVQSLPWLSLATTLTASGLEMIGAAFLVHIISLR
jgi:hypothetical protein